MPAATPPSTRSAPTPVTATPGGLVRGRGGVTAPYVPPNTAANARRPGGQSLWSPIPGATIDIGQVRRDTLVATARPASDVQLTYAALDALVPVVYGTQYVGGLIAGIYNHSKWVFWIIWAEGTVADVSDVTIDDVSWTDKQWLPNALSHTKYTGNQTTVDPTLLAAIRARLGADHQFNETCAGLAYSVVGIPFAALSNPPSFKAKIRGRKIYDPRAIGQVLTDSTTWQYSENPSLILADYLTNTTWGAGLTVDWTSVATCADLNDTLIGTAPNQEKSRIANIVIDREAPVDSWIETLRSAAGVFLVRNQMAVKFIPDVRIAGDALLTLPHYSHNAGQIIELREPVLRDVVSLPTAVEIQFTDTSKTPWETLSADPVVIPGQNVPYRKSVVPMPWITRRSQATREGIERLNKLWLSNVTFPLHVFDEGIVHEPGDLIRVTYPEAGFDSLPMRVLSNEATAQGWMLTLEKYDPAAYSETVQSEPSIPITDLPSPFAPPQVTWRDTPPETPVVEELKQILTGAFISRLHVTWDDMREVYPFVAGYIIAIMQGDTVVQGPITAPPTTHEFVTGALPENLLYTVSLKLLSITGRSSTAVTYQITNSLRLSSIPTDVSSITGFEVSGQVHLQWVPASDPDLTAHELRWGYPTHTNPTPTQLEEEWDTYNDAAHLLDRVAAPAIRYTTANVLPPGDWRIYIKGLDSLRSETCLYGQESEHPAYVDVTVTSDAEAYVYGDYTFATATLVNMSAHLHADGATFWVTDFGQTWNALFGGAAMNTFTQPLYTYHTSGTSSLTTDAYDFDTTLSGDWIASLEYATLGVGDTAEPVLDLSLDGVTWYPHALTSRIKATARFTRLRVSAYTTSTLLVTDLGAVHVQLATRSESSPAPITTDARTGVGKLVELEGNYLAAKSVRLDVLGSTFATTAVDRILVAPAPGLYFTTTHVGTGNLYTYWQIGGGYTIQTGDYLEYDVYLLPTSIDTTSLGCIGGMEIDLTGAAPNTGRALGLVDQFGVSLVYYSPASHGPAGRWVHRKISLAPAVGRVVVNWDVVCESDTVGLHEAVYANIRVTDGANATRATIYGTGGEPSVSTKAYASVGNIDMETGPANSFLAFAFGASGAQIAANLNWTFEGV